ncbi:MAG: GIY-YIG nuclease family protein [Alphaproteobacteria bacterium]|nr:GIY-YIG nuclease family protein [Alphaproteobacteria bacterium]MDX5416720.1 GIY-YIG nuclease family protein [Alphaproteobacteria bacterium]MDX5494104.1 GIY-YIG nuclease family protein [Alphaproteobacteria bacterium]
MTHSRTESSESRDWYLYILECAGGRLYTGITLDPEARFRAHSAGKGAKFTRSYKPQRIVLVRRYGSRAEAQREEYALKQLSAAAKRELIRTAAEAGTQPPAARHAP